MLYQDIHLHIQTALYRCMILDVGEITLQAELLPIQLPGDLMQRLNKLIKQVNNDLLVIRYFLYD